MKTVFVVTSGIYSDYHIDGIFSTKELAAAFVKKLKDDETSVEIWNLDERKEWILRDAWCAVIYVADGRMDKSYTNRSQSDELAPANKKLRSIQHTFHGGSDYVSVESYVSQEHAIKAVVEVRQQILRERVLNPKYQHPGLGVE